MAAARTAAAAEEEKRAHRLLSAARRLPGKILGVLLLLQWQPASQEVTRSSSEGVGWRTWGPLMLSCSGSGRRLVGIYKARGGRAGVKNGTCAVPAQHGRLASRAAPVSYSRPSSGPVLAGGSVRAARTSPKRGPLAPVRSRPVPAHSTAQRTQEPVSMRPAALARAAVPLLLVAALLAGTAAAWGAPAAAKRGRSLVDTNKPWCAQSCVCCLAGRWLS